MEARSAPPAMVEAPPAVAEAAPLCSLHVLKPEPGVCQQCGACYCVRCVPGDAWRTLCPGCNAALAASEAPEKLRKLYQELCHSMLGMSVVGFGVFFALVSSAGSSPVLGVLLGLIIGGLAFALTVRMGTYPSVDAAWSCFALELFILLIAVGVNPSLCGALALLRAVYQAFKVKELWTLVKLRSAVALPTNS